MKEVESVIDTLYRNRQAVPEMMRQEEGAILYCLYEALSDNPADYGVEVRRKAYSVLLYIIGNDGLLELKLRWTMFFNALCVQFVNSDYRDLMNDLRLAYYSIVKYIDGIVWRGSGISGEMICEEENETGPVVVVASQILNVMHSPTRSVLDYTYTIAGKLGIPVKLINDSGMHIDPRQSWVQFFFREDPNSSDSISYNEMVIPFYQAKRIMPDIEEITILCNAIREMKPRLVLNVGAHSIVTDLCRHFAKTASIPCAFEIPLSMSEYLLLPRRTHESDRSVTEVLLSYQKVVNTRYNYCYDHPEDEAVKYDRSMFDIEDSAFVLVTVGHRLDLEMDDAFLETIRIILEKNENALFLIIGDVSDKDRVKRQIHTQDRVRFTGKISCSGECTEIADVYLNPQRAGGGMSSFEALYKGKPVVTPEYGDVWGAAGDDFAVKDYAEMISRVDKLISDASYYAEMSVKARKRAEELADMESTVRALFIELGVM